jgi:hypothetical protein
VLRTNSQAHDQCAETESDGWPLVGRFTFGVILGLAIGIIDVLLMLPLAFPDKRAALLGAFSSRFALGFFATVVKLPMSPIASGVLVGVLTSIPGRDRYEGLRADSHDGRVIRRDRGMGGRPVGGAALTINAGHAASCGLLVSGHSW